jgi:cell division protein FtsB
MTDENLQAGRNAAGSADGATPAPLPKRALDWARRAWRPAATAVAVALTLLLGWHAVNGRNGLTVWQQKRAEDRQLQKEIQGLDQENARLRERIEHLKSDPEAIEHEAREKLHYAKPGEVIYTLPAQEQTPAAGASK